MAVPKAILYRLLLLIDTGKIPDVAPDKPIPALKALIIVD
jgi:hypothetical protein